MPANLYAPLPSYGPVPRHLRVATRGGNMLDIILILLMLGLFAAGIAYAYGCEGL